MTLFYWRSKTLENYALGHIIVEAPGEPEARRKAMNHFDDVLKTHWDWDSEYLAEKRESFRADLEREDPREIEVLCIWGSE